MKKRILSLLLVMAMLCAFVPVVSAERYINIGEEYVIESGESVTVTLPKDTYYKFTIECGSDTWWKISTGTSSFGSQGTNDSVRKLSSGELQFTIFLLSDYSSSVPLVGNCKLKIDFLEGNGQCGDNLTWTLNNDGLLTISGNGDMWDWTHYSAPWYFGPNASGAIKKVIIENGVTSIGSCAFYYSGLQSVEIPEGVTSIGSYAFYGCADLQNIDLPNSLELINDFAFYKCTGISSITIPCGVMCIKEGTFIDCHNLNNIYVNPENNYYSSINGVLFNKDRTELVKYPEGKDDTEYIIPSGTILITERAFSSCNDLQNIIIPDSVTAIGEYAFLYTGLTSLYIPSSVKSIGECAFEWCSNLKKIYIEKGVEEIKTLAFKDIGLRYIYYRGNENDWKNISIEDISKCFDFIKVHYNATGTNPPKLGTLDITNAGAMINVPLSSVEYDSTMVTAFYRDGVLVDMLTMPISTGDRATEIPITNKNADIAKLFIWSSVDSMEPLCDAESISLNAGDT